VEAVSDQLPTTAERQDVSHGCSFGSSSAQQPLIQTQGLDHNVGEPDLQMLRVEQKIASVHHDGTLSNGNIVLPNTFTQNPDQHERPKNSM
jgi:hypothetical protein